MVDIARIRTALAQRLEVIDDLQVYPYFAGTIHPPAAAFTLGLPGGSMAHPGIDYATTFGSGSPMLWTLRVLVSLAHEESAVDQLDAYISTGPSSVVAALEADNEPLADTSGQLADFVQVPSLIQAGPMTWGGTDHLGGEWLVQVHAS